MAQILDPFQKLADINPYKYFVIKEIKAKKTSQLPDTLKDVLITFEHNVGLLKLDTAIITYHHNNVEYSYSGNRVEEAPLEGKKERAQKVSQEFIDQHAKLFNQSAAPLKEALEKQLKKQKKTDVEVKTSKAWPTKKERLRLANRTRAKNIS